MEGEPPAWLADRGIPHSGKGDGKEILELKWKFPLL